MKIFLALMMLAAAAPAQTPAASLQCDPAGWYTNGLENFCQIVEIPVGFGGTLAVTATNGAISVHGWDGDAVLVRVRIQAAAPTVYEAQSLAAQVAIDTSNNQVHASGPSSTPSRNWGVSYEIFVPHAADLTVTTANGAISIADLQGNIRFTVSNGAVSLAGLAGQVQGKVANGAVAIALGGDHWDGQGLDVSTANGAISIAAPHEYSAHFEASTTVGVVTTNYPVQVSRGRWGIPGLGGSLSFDAGSGGATIRVATTVGTIRIEQGQ
ncbi:MAG TPA: DUF4097 family beta strand repeat-containing protein [Candidatus Acidoferrales bacterium]|nr:DUF4097 family beta strand repeat-containing protein [Candidatus Acidoferrales bacterium]